MYVFFIFRGYKINSNIIFKRSIIKQLSNWAFKQLNGAKSNSVVQLSSQTLTQLDSWPVNQFNSKELAQ